MLQDTKEIARYLAAIRTLVNDPADQESALCAAEFLHNGSPMDKQLLLLLHRYMYNFPDDTAVQSAFIAAQRSMFDRQLAASVIIDKTNVPAQYRISAIVSTWNAEEFIEECLSDLEAQTIADQLEIIFIDAASPQREYEIVAGFQSRYPNIKYVRTPERINIYEAWNLAIHLARGEYLTTFSTNDRLNPAAYEILTKALDSNPDKVLAYGDSLATERPHQQFHCFDPSIRLDGGWKYHDYDFMDLLLHLIIGPHPMWRRQLHDTVGFFNGRYRAIGDQDLWRRMGRIWEFVHVPQVTGLFWYSDDSLSNHADNQWEFEETAIQHQNIFLADHYRGELPERFPAQSIRQYLESKLPSSQAVRFTQPDGTVCDRVIFRTVQEMHDCVIRLLERGHTALAIGYFDLYRCLFEHKAQCRELALIVDSAREKCVQP